MADRPAHTGEAPDQEIEVTPEMIDAGVDVLSAAYLAMYDGSDVFPQIVQTVYRRMVAVRQLHLESRERIRG